MLLFKKWITIVWVFICIMDKVAKQSVFHCGLYLSNVFVHIQYDKTLCIGVCDWKLMFGLRRSQDQFFVVGPMIKNNTQNQISVGCTMIFFHMYGTLFALLNDTILKPPMYTHVTKAWLISKFTVATWKGKKNVLMIPCICTKLIRIDLNKISAWSWKWCCLKISTKERCNFLVTSFWTHGLAAQQ
jgi:hypothetical protein